MMLTLELPPEILDRLTQGAIAHGVSLADYTTQILTVSLPEFDRSKPSQQVRQAWIQQRREGRRAIVTGGPALSQTVIESRIGERY
jgi:hypothetical protein